jgi:hypothetical protein
MARTRNVNPRVGTARGRVAAHKRHHGPDSPQAIAAADELATALSETYPERFLAYIERTLAKAPPLTGEQRARLRELLKPVAVGVGGDSDGAI